MENEDKNISTKNIIIEKLENGMNFKDSCSLAGIDESTGHRYKGLVGEEKRRFDDLRTKDVLSEQEKEELKKLTNKDALCTSFASRCDSAIIRYKEKLIGFVNKGSVKDARHAIEMLRSKWPEEFNIAKKVEHSGGISVEIGKIAEKIQEVIDEPETDQSNPDAN